MTFSHHHRQILFFFAAVLLPCAVLVALSLRMVRQDRELAEKRVADDRRRTTSDIRQELLARLERIKAQVANAWATGEGPAPAEVFADPVVTLVARIDGARPVLPWDMTAPADNVSAILGQPQFSAKIRQAEEQEFVKRDYTNAAALYGEAVRVATHPTQLAHAQLLQARAEARAGKQDAAETRYREILTLASDATDEQGIPVALYAAAGLLQLGAGYPAVLERIQALSEAKADWLPATAYLVRDLLESLARSAPISTAAAARQELVTIHPRIHFLEQALGLQKDFAGLGLGKALDNDTSDLQPVWVPYAEASWLVSVAPSQGEAPPLMIAVQSDDTLLAVDKLVAAASKTLGLPRILAGWDPGGESLGPNFPGMQVAFTTKPDVVLARQLSTQGWFYLITLGLVLSVTLFAAYLLWRDVQRELRLANLRSQFVSSVSHELKTPLTAIRMFAETLSLGRTRDPQIQGEYLETIVNESARLTRLLNNVLDFSKIEQGNKIYRLEPTCLADVVQAAARSMHYPLAQQGFKLGVQIDNRLPPVRADADAIEQAILNLLTNALKYSGASREIELTLRREDRHALIQVRDHGIGISAPDQAHIFEKFYRVAMAQRVPGTGLGLTLVQHIARAHGGDVEVTSQLGKGSTFTIRLPLEENA